MCWPRECPPIWRFNGSAPWSRLPRVRGDGMVTEMSSYEEYWRLFSGHGAGWGWATLAYGGSGRSGAMV